VSLLDRGLPGREINGNIPVIYLYNSTEKYYGYVNPWLSGKGRHRFEYALVARDSDWSASRIPQLAWEYNCPVTPVAGCKQVKPQSYVRTSPNVIVEAMRRVGSDIEIRLVESLGEPGDAEVTIDLPHTGASLTDLNGEHPEKLNGGPDYRFPIRAQQIITLRARTESPVADTKPLLEWGELVPQKKQADLHEYLKNVKGHPPKGS